MEDGFCKAQSDNLPRIDAAMMASYFSNCPDFCTAEIRGVKADRSARESYGDKAVGYVQVKREGQICIVKGRITPEHRVRTKAYSVEVQCDEREEVVLSAQCNDCAASQGGCKHAIAFLAWLHRRSEDPSPTSVECYWKRSSLAGVGTSQKCIKAAQLGPRRMVPLPPGDDSLLREFLAETAAAGITDMQLAPYYLAPTLEDRASLHYLYAQFKKCGTGATAEEFLIFSKNEMTVNVCSNVAKLTVNQSESPLWHELRYGRITASKIYDVSRCQTVEGSLTESLLGMRVRTSKAMKRGQALEDSVFKHLKKELHEPLKKSGLLLHPEYPFFGASPDGIGNTFVVEIKCPISTKTLQTYFSKDGSRPAVKYYSQMQLQMLFADKRKALFCVAHPDYQSTKATTQLWVDFDMAFINNLMKECHDFWVTAIFERL